MIDKKAKRYVRIQYMRHKAHSVCSAMSLRLFGKDITTAGQEAMERSTPAKPAAMASLQSDVMVARQEGRVSLHHNPGSIPVPKLNSE